MKTAEFWEARIGLGYNKISSINHKIQCDITYFVPLDENLEIWDIKIKNLSDKKAQYISDNLCGVGSWWFF